MHHTLPCHHILRVLYLLIWCSMCPRSHIIYIYIYTGFLSGGGGGEHLPPLGSLSPPLGTGRFVSAVHVERAMPPTKLHIAVLPPLGPNPERNTDIYNILLCILSPIFVCYCIYTITLDKVSLSLICTRQELVAWE